MTLSIMTLSIMSLFVILSVIDHTHHNSIECLYAECCYAERRDFFIVMLSVIILIVIMQNVVMLCVMAPSKVLNLGRLLSGLIFTW